VYGHDAASWFLYVATGVAGKFQNKIIENLQEWKAESRKEPGSIG